MENVKIVEIDTTNSIKSVKDLRKGIKELQDAFVAGKLSEEEFRQQLDPLTDSLVKMTNATNDSKMASNDLGVVLKNVSTTLSTGMAAVQGVSAALNLMGVESEDAVKAIQKMQSIMALSDTFSKLADDGPKAFKALKMAIGSATKGLKGFKLALVSTGIGAIVVAVGLLIANFDKLKNLLEPGLSEVLSGVKSAFSSFGDSIKNVGNIIKTVVKTYIGTLVTAVTGLGQVLYKFFTGDWAGAKEAGIQAAQSIKEGFSDAGKEIADNARQIGENTANAYNEGVEKKRAENAKKRQEELDKQWAEERKILEQNLQLEAKLRESQEKDGWKLTEQGKKYYDNYFNTRLSWYKKDSKEYKEILIQKNNYDKEYTNKVKQELDAQKAAEAQKRQEENELRAKEQEEVGKILDNLATSQNDARTNELNALADKYQQEYDLLVKYGMDTTALTEKFRKDQADVNKKYDDEEKKREDDKRAEEAQKRQDKITNLETDAALENEILYNKLLNGEISQKEFDLRKQENDTALREQKIQQLQEDLQNENLTKEERLRIQTELNDELFKKLDEEKEKRKQTAQTAMNFAQASADFAVTMLNGLADAEDKNTKEGFERSKKLQIASATIQMLSGIAAAIASAMTIPPPAGPIMGAINAASVAATGAFQIAKIKKTKFESSGTSSGGSSAAVSTPASFNAASTLADTTQSTRNVVTTSEQEQQMTNTKVYVTETDITNTTNNVKTQVSENSF